MWTVSTYVLRKRLSGVLGTFHAISYGSLYPCLKDLEARGLLQQSTSPEAAQLLGIGRNTITRKIQELGLDD